MSLFLRISNFFMTPLLRSPLHFLASGGVMLITFTGRKSGKVYTTPVEYRREGHVLTVATRKERLWWKNLQGSAPVTVRLRGREISAAAEIAPMDEAAVQEAVKHMYPRMSSQRTVELAAITVIVKIHLPQTQAVRAL